MINYIEVALNLPLPQTFFYKNLESDDKKYATVDVGFRVEVPFKNRKLIACVVATYENLPEKCSDYKDKIKKINRVIDKDAIFTSELINLAKWISKFYICTLGEAIFTMIPSGKKESSISNAFEADIESFTKISQSDEQMNAVKAIFDGAKSENKMLFHYLYGPTGTGKTEVFLSCAEKVLDEGKGVIYLVPEISLTHQVVEAITMRFGNKIAVLHSALTGSQKLSEWKKILDGSSRIVIGARSAIFAPVPKLGLIIIDEEHDISYKSGTTPRYHARQVAMRRALEQNIPLVMGSATPSVEAWHLMQNEKVACHTLTKRLAGGKMPEIEVVDLSKPDAKGRKLTGCISSKLENEIKMTLAEKKQTILFLNRRGFSHFFRCNSCGYELKCKNCSVTMTYHRAKKRLICHYCGYSIDVPEKCPECNSYDVAFLGFGTEFIESEVKAKFPLARVERIDTDNLKSQEELKQKLLDFRHGKTDILLGTQMVAKGLNFPNLKLVGVVLADTALHLPDFRAAERAFSLIVQVSGRAGRFFPDGKVIVQSYFPERNAIWYACKNEIASFYKDELEQRKILNFPPYSRMIRLVFRSSIQQEAEKVCGEAAEIFYAMLENNKNEQFEILGPSECPLAKISANFRYQIILRNKSLSVIQKAVTSLIYDYKNTRPVYIEVDVDPVNLL